MVSQLQLCKMQQQNVLNYKKKIANVPENSNNWSSMDKIIDILIFSDNPFLFGSHTCGMYKKQKIIIINE